MSKFTVTTESVIPSRTPDESTKVIDAKDANEAWGKARNDSEVAWGYRQIVSIEEIESS